MSLFDQHEDQHSTSHYVKHLNSLLNPSTMENYKDFQEHQSSIFKRHKIDFVVEDLITQIAVSNNQMIIAMRNKKLLRIDLLAPEQLVEIELGPFLGEKSQIAKLYRLSLSPNGKNCILSFTSDLKNLTPYDNLFLAKKIYSLSKLKGHIITAVGWNFSSETYDSTSNILIGTSKGLIFEAEFSLIDSKSRNVNIEKYCYQVFDVGEEAGPITGIEFQKIDNFENIYLVIFTTPNRLYQCFGKPYKTDMPHLSSLFNNHLGRFQDMPGNLGYSKLDFFRSSTMIPEIFGWLTEPGVLWRKIAYDLNSSSNTVSNETCLITYNKEDSYYRPLSEENIPIDFILTEFHILVLFKNKLRVICCLNDQIIMDDKFNEPLIGICKDLVNGTIWVYSSSSVYRYKIINEERDIWRIYLQKKDFQKAKAFALNMGSAELDVVNLEEAQYYFDKKDFLKSAKLYAKSSKILEEIALKFMQVNNKEGLKKFLSFKLESVPAKNVSQISLISLWLIEIIMYEIGNLQKADSSKDDKLDSLKSEFKALVNNPQVNECLNRNKKTIYDLISIHGDEESLIYFATSINDFDYAVNYFIERHKFEECLKILREQKNVSLLYRYSPHLIREVPKELISILKENCLFLDQFKLLPTLIQSNNGLKSEQIKEVINYLEHCVKLRITDSTVHNYLLALYSETSPTQLLNYLESRDDWYSVEYNINYALRICTELGLKKACVNLYTLIGLYEEAIDMALSANIELAKETVKKSQMDDDMRKKLWLKIARHVVEKDKDIDKVNDLLKACNLLKIEDILPFFSDFVTIGQFKEAICSSLSEYSRHIEALKEEMKDTTESAEQIRKETETLKTQSITIRNIDKCCICKYSILSRAFYAFPCRHLFHSNCVLLAIQDYLSHQQIKRLRDIQAMIESYIPKASANLESEEKIRKLETELDELIASQCLYCGDFMIDAINQPFISSKESEALEGW